MEVVMKSKSISLAVLVFLALPSSHGFAQDRVGSSEVRAEAPRPASQSTPVAAHSSGSLPDLLIGAGDLLEVSLYGMADFKTDVRVNYGGVVFPSAVATRGVGGTSVPPTGCLIDAKRG